MSATLEHASLSLGPDLGRGFGTVSDVRQSAGYEAGYRRGVNEVLAELALIAAEVGRERPEARDALRLVRRRLEQVADGDLAERPAAVDGYVDGGLGI